MNKLTILAAAAATAITFGAAGAYAQAGGDFAKVDANHDNGVTYEEAVGAFPTITQDDFNKADANADGKLDDAEFASLQGLIGGTTTGANDTSSASSAAGGSGGSSSASGSSSAQ